jgi:hypothetical protein
MALAYPSFHLNNGFCNLFWRFSSWYFFYVLFKGVSCRVFLSPFIAVFCTPECRCLSVCVSVFLWKCLFVDYSRKQCLLVAFISACITEIRRVSVVDLTQWKRSGRITSWFEVSLYRGCFMRLILRGGCTKHETKQRESKTGKQLPFSRWLMKNFNSLYLLNDHSVSN